MALSEEQIIDLFNEACRETFNGLERFRHFARAIEAEVRKQAEPLTPSQYNIALGCATDIPPSRYEAVTRAIERAHGITQKGGS